MWIEPTPARLVYLAGAYQDPPRRATFPLIGARGPDPGRSAKTQTPPLAIGVANGGARVLSDEPNQGHTCLP
jgi:hypothetical protein